MIIRFLLFSALFVSCSHSSLDMLGPVENRYNLSTVNDLKNEDYTRLIDTFYNAGTEGFFTGANNIQIYYKYFRQNGSEKGAIVISSGRTEAAIKYKEVLFDLFNIGYSIYIHDHRGQGLSGRMVEDPDMGYIDEFRYYIDDLKYFYDFFVSPGAHKNIFLLAHSMGGAIGMTYLERYPEDFSAAAFSSPMLGLSFPSCEFVKLFEGEEVKYAPGQGNYEEGLSSFRKNHLTGCKTRYNIMLMVYEEFPEARLGGATYQWVDKSCQQLSTIFKNVSKIKTPLLLFSAEDDKVVSTAAHSHFVETMKESGGEISAFSIEGAQHELLIEKDEFRIEVMTKTLDFFKEH